MAVVFCASNSNWPTTMTTTTPSILLIDNNEKERTTFATYLQGQGYGVYEANDLKQGFSLLHKHQPQLVLCDLNVPTESQQGVLQSIQSDFTSCPVIVMSSDEVIADVVAALRHGASDFIIRPLADMEVVIHAVKRVLEQEQLRQENQHYREQLENTNRELQASLKVLKQDQLAGKQVQRKMLPTNNQRFSGMNFSRRIVPSFYLSGDFVDYFMVGDDHVVFFIADVSGHGASSAFLTVLLKNMFARKRSDYFHRHDSTILSPVAMLDVANRNLLSTGIGKHATLCVGVINLKNNSLLYSVAGHLPLPIIVVDGKARYLPCEGMPVGLFERPQFAEKTLLLPEKFVLTFFSDGILEVVQAEGLIAREQLLLQRLQAAPDSIDGVVDALALNELVEAPDDIAVLLISR